MTRRGPRAEVPIPVYLMSCHSCGHGFDLFESMATAPTGTANPCPACKAYSAGQDYAGKRVQVGFTDPTEIVRVPKRARGEREAVRGTRNHAAVNKAGWSELCKRNDWTDVSSSAPPDDYHAHLNPRVGPEGGATTDHPATRTSADAPAQTFTYSSRD